MKLRQSLWELCICQGSHVVENIGTQLFQPFGYFRAFILTIRSYLVSVLGMKFLQPKGITHFVVDTIRFYQTNAKI